MYHREIREAAYLQANLELKKKEFEEKNEELIAENKDLNGFTTDGQIVRNNMNKIQDEVDKLKSQIAETTPDYQQLLEERDRLIKEIEIAEQRAMNSKNAKFINTAGLKGAADDGQENLVPGKQKSVIPVISEKKEETEAERK